MTIADVIRAGIAEGLDTEIIVARVQAAFPAARGVRGRISYHRRVARDNVFAKMDDAASRSKLPPRKKYRYEPEPMSIRKFIDHLRKKTLPWLTTLGDKEKPAMSPEAGRLIAEIYEQMANVLTEKAKQYQREFPTC